MPRRWYHPAMNRPYGLISPSSILLIASFCAVVSDTADTQKPTARHPNVVVFLADDLGYTGSTFYESPNIDALAKRGTVFTNAYSACPVCSPTRAALMTGRYPARV